MATSSHRADIGCEDRQSALGSRRKLSRTVLCSCFVKACLRVVLFQSRGGQADEVKHQRGCRCWARGRSEIERHVGWAASRVEIAQNGCVGLTIAVVVFVESYSYDHAETTPALFLEAPTLLFLSSALLFLSSTLLCLSSTFLFLLQTLLLAQTSCLLFRRQLLLQLENGSLLLVDNFKQAVVGVRKFAQLRARLLSDSVVDQLDDIVFSFWFEGTPARH